MHTPRHAHPGRQRGAALLTAMIIVTLVATLASAMVWQQWRAVQIEASERSRAQAAWILSGALDFAKLILFEQKAGVTALTDPWATPLEEARISTFLAVDKSNPDDGPEAFLSGNIDDAQALYNLGNLVTNGTVDPVQLQVLQRLCEAVGIESSVAQRIATGMVSASTTTSAAAPLMPSNVAQLTWFGIDPASVQALTPYIILIQQLGAIVATPVNVNTASAQVLTAVANLDPATAAHLVQVRQSKPFVSVADFLSQAALTATPPPVTALDIHSNYFMVHGRLRLADHVLLETSLLTRGQRGQFVVLTRERVASIE
ncbi:MAG TPA: type II secretion system minor pseudopilin GspK [Burkholderiaceae bacterium]|jgi:general secretion pathway protein K